MCKVKCIGLALLGILGCTVHEREPGDAQQPGVAVSSFPVGTVMGFAGATAPDGWLLCNGDPLNRLTYTKLFEIIGETYGSGDGMNSFNLPDLRGRAPIGTGHGPGLTDRALGDAMGSETHTLTVNEMPSHSHSEHPTAGTNWYMVFQRGSGTWGDEKSGNVLGQTTGATGGDQPHNNMQPSLTINFIIKY